MIVYCVMERFIVKRMTSEWSTFHELAAIYANEDTARMTVEKRNLNYGFMENGKHKYFLQPMEVKEA